MPYSGVFVFGDSLVDVGNALGLAEWYDDLPFAALPDGAPTTVAGYFDGRFSNGYTFVDLIANKAIGVVTDPIFPFGYEDPWLGVPIAPFRGDPEGNNLNFAYGGAHIRKGDEAVPDFDGQTDAFKNAVDNRADPNALYIFTFGGNDVRDLAPTGRDPVPQADAYAELQRCADKFLREIGQLIDIGVRNVVITGLPDVGLIPHYDRDGDGVLNATEQMRSDAATDYSIYLDGLFRAQVVPALKAMGANVTYVPVMNYQDPSGNIITGALNANLPTLAALNGMTTDELTQNWLANKDIVFFDHVHPNAQAHALLASYMQAMISGTAWVETMPLTETAVDYRAAGSIGAAGEVDGFVFALAAGTTYTFEALGISSLGTTGSLADAALRMLNSGGSLVGSNDDSGIGFDAMLSVAPATAGNYTLQLSAVGMLTGSYVLQAAMVSGAAMQAGNSYSVTNAATIVLEGAGGIGQDTVSSSVSYALSAGSEIEVLRTSNDKGKGALNLTGNEFNQTIIGNAGANILEGKGGADTYTGGAGKDVFVLGPAALLALGNVDRILDYGRDDLVDLSQILKVGAGVDIVGGGYLRITSSGFIQLDVDGGANHWVTVSTINGTNAVNIRYLSGTSQATASVSRVTEQMSAMETVDGKSQLHADATVLDSHNVLHLLGDHGGNFEGFSPHGVGLFVG
jgi:phospholipase/lecithinase/hemolysin